MNPEPGTVVDQCIVGHNEPEFSSSGESSEFYLVSQKTLQGTAVPTHYSICFNNTDIKMSDLQELTYKLCYTYFNVSGSIRVPSLIQYATRFSTLIGDLSKGSKSKKQFSAVLPHKHLEENVQSLFYI